MSRPPKNTEATVQRCGDVIKANKCLDTWLPLNQGISSQMPRNKLLSHIKRLSECRIPLHLKWPGIVLLKTKKGWGKSWVYVFVKRPGTDLDPSSSTNPISS